MIDIELQSYPMEALGKRIRYYESMLNMDTLMQVRMKKRKISRFESFFVIFIHRNLEKMILTNVFPSMLQR